MSFDGNHRWKHGAPALAAGALLTVCMSAGLAEPAQPPSPIVHALDETVWVASWPINWPGPDHTVLTYFDVEESVSICGRYLTAEAKANFGAKSEILFGTACGHLVVLFKPLDGFSSDLARRLAAAHEAFHIAVQSNSLLPRIDVVSMPDPSKEEIQSVNALAVDLIALLRRKGTSATEVCVQLKTGYDALQPTAKSYFSYKTYWEWPAEFYMRAAVLGGGTFGDYLARRRELSSGVTEPIYIAGALALEWTERRISRAEWQGRYTHGETILNLFAESIDCTPFDRPTLQADSFTTEEIFTDVAP